MLEGAMVGEVWIDTEPSNRIGREETGQISRIIEE
jgi:hypothetical protein